jgi:hypothetical protein
LRLLNAHKTQSPVGIKVAAHALSKRVFFWSKRVFRIKNFFEINPLVRHFYQKPDTDIVGILF